MSSWVFHGVVGHDGTSSIDMNNVDDGAILRKNDVNETPGVFLTMTK
jgi:hypothetical protein